MNYLRLSIFLMTGIRSQINASEGVTSYERANLFCIWLIGQLESKTIFGSDACIGHRLCRCVYWGVELEDYREFIFWAVLSGPVASLQQKPSLGKSDLSSLFGLSHIYFYIIYLLALPVDRFKCWGQVHSLKFKSDVLFHILNSLALYRLLRNVWPSSTAGSGIVNDVPLQCTWSYSCTSSNLC